MKRYAASMRSFSQQDCIIIKIASIYTIKEKFCLSISAKFSCAIHQSKTFHPAFGDTKERHTVHMRMMFRRCGLGLPCVFSQPSHTWHKLFSGLLIFPESVCFNSCSLAGNSIIDTENGTIQAHVLSDTSNSTPGNSMLRLITQFD